MSSSPSSPSSSGASPSEFDLIRRHFSRPTRHTTLAGGDDAALFSVRPGMELVVSTDMLVSGTHFFADTDPGDLGWKTLAVNVSDLAAMGACPRWALLALALPAVDEDWLAAFANGLFACASAFDIDLVGGDTTRGPLNLAVTLIGEVAHGSAITRAGAHTGDELWVSGQPGRAALGLAHLRGELQLNAPADFIAALQRPQPRLALGQKLRGLASAMLDVSDGLLGDLAHILTRSAVGAIIEQNALPLSALYQAGVDEETAQRSLLGGGDDFELLFTAPSSQRAAIIALAAQLGLPLHRIGQITPQCDGLLLRDRTGKLQSLTASGYDHFRPAGSHA